MTDDKKPVLVTTRDELVKHVAAVDRMLDVHDASLTLARAHVDAAAEFGLRNSVISNWSDSAKEYCRKADALAVCRALLTEKLGRGVVEVAP